VSQPDFDLRALYDALDERRRMRGLSWTAVAREMGRGAAQRPVVAASTITGLEGATAAEGDGVLQMLLWLGRAPESFIAAFLDADAARFRLADPGDGRMLRWDAAAIHTALDAKRRAAGLTWQDVGREIGGITSGMLTNLANGGRVSLPGVMRIVRWLGQPAANFTRVSSR
jgi:uncharacterized protein YfiM (DUF2279 family)